MPLLRKLVLKSYNLYITEVFTRTLRCDELLICYAKENVTSEIYGPCFESFSKYTKLKSPGHIYLRILTLLHREEFC